MRRRKRWTTTKRRMRSKTRDCFRMTKLQKSRMKRKSKLMEQEEATLSRTLA